MTDFSKALSVTASALKAQATRLRHVTENVAHADTPGYRRKMVSFEAVRSADSNATMVEVSRVRLDPADLQKVHDPSHPLADDTGHFESSNVNLMLEIADAREAQRSYEANLKVFEQSRAMMAGLMDLLRK